MNISRTSEISDRINMLRFLMIAGVVLLHVPEYVPIGSVKNEPFSLIKAYFQLAVFRGSVPVLTFISGYLLFQASADLHYAKLLQKKWGSLAVPFLAFNIGLLVVAYVATHALGITTSVDLTKAGAMEWANAAFGLTASPINYPLNFLRDLMVLVVIAPAFGFMLRHAPWPGLLIVAVVFMYNLDGYLILRSDMPLVFYMGGLAAVRKWDMNAFDRFAAPCLALFLLFCAYIIAFRVANTNALRLAAPLLIWPAASLISTTGIGKWMAHMSKYSLFIFLSHAPVLLVSWLAYKRVDQYVPYELYWVASPVATIAILVAVHKLFTAVAPDIFGSITGTPAKRRTQLRVLPE